MILNKYGITLNKANSMVENYNKLQKKFNKLQIIYPFMESFILAPASEFPEIVIFF